MKEHLKSFIDESNTPHVRGLRILLEYFYATEIFEDITRKKMKIISVFGSARTKPHSKDYVFAHKLGKLLYQSNFAVVTGASRGIMQAANQGVADAIAEEVRKKTGAKNLDAIRKTKMYWEKLKQHSVGLSISLPMESENNPFVGVSATFHYFMVRKFFFGALSSGFVACEGGWGTRDELYEILTLVQTGKAPLMPIVYLSDDTKHLEDDLKHTLKKEYISKEDMSLIKLAQTPEQAAREIRFFYRNLDSITYERDSIVRLKFRKKLSEAVQIKVEKLIEVQADHLQDLEWKEKELILLHYRPHSYGDLRRAIDLINKS